MMKQKFRDNLTLTGVTLIFVALAALSYIAPRLQNTETVSSQKIEEILYERVDKYNRAVRNIPGMSDIVMNAEKNPVELTEDERQLYLTYQRRFYDGWEAAWNYYHSGHFDASSWNKWNSWYVNEARLRPRFGWTENRAHFSGAFLRHVDASIDRP